MPSSRPLLLEVCVDSLRSALAAEEGGADRIELCHSLAEGGLTPSAGLIECVRERCQLPVLVMLRPRSGDFIYDEFEQEEILRDLQVARDLGADGFVSGALTASGDVDVHFTERLVRAAGEEAFTFHRAFDHCRDPHAALEALVACGVTRLLTSGQAASVEEGSELLAELNRRAAGRIELLLGGGVRAETLAQVLDETGALEVHSSASVALAGSMDSARAEVQLGRGTPEPVARRVTDAGKVAQLKAILAARS